MADDEVYVVDEAAGGRLAKVPRSQLASLSSEFRIATPEEIPELERKVKAGGQKAMAAAEGLMSGVSLGGFDYWARNNVSPEQLADIQARRDTTAGTIGEGVGMVAPVLLSGGTGAVAKGASVLPSALAARGAAAVGARVGEAAAARGVGTIGAKAAALAAEGATEGFIVGAGQAVSELSLADQDLDTEKVFAGAGEGALWGLGGGAILGGGIGAAQAAKGLPSTMMSAARQKLAARRATKEGAEALPASTVDDAAEEFTGNSIVKEVEEPDFVSKMLSKVSGGDAAVIQRAKSLGDDGVRMRNNYINREAVKENATKKLTQHINDFVATEPVIRNVFAGERKLENVARTVKRGLEPVEGARSFITQLKDETADLLTLEGRELVSKKGAVNMRKVINRTEKRVNEIIRKGVDVEPQLFIQMDKLKRDFQRWTKTAGQSRASDSIAVAENAGFTSYANGVQQRILSHLEDASVYGEAAAQQARRNAIGSEYFDTANDFGRRFLSETGERLDPETWWQNKRVANPELVSKHIDGLLDYRKDLGHQMTLKSVQRRRQLLDVLIEQGDVPAKELETFKRARQSTVEMENTLKETGESLSDANAITELQRIESERGALAGMAGGALGGSILGGPIGGIVGGVMGSAVRPGAAIHKLAVMESIAQRSARVDSKIEKSLSKHIRNESAPEPPAIKAMREREPKRATKLLGAARRGAAASTAAAIVAFGDTPESRRSKYLKVTEQVREFQQNPTAAIEHVQRNVVGSLAGSAPAFSAALAAKHASAMSFLAGKLPPQPTHIGRSLQPHLHKPQVTDAEVERFARYATAVSDPLSVLDDVSKGKLSVEAVEAVREVYPKLYEQIRNSAMVALSKTKRELPYQSVIQLGILLDFVAHPTLEPAFMARHQQRMAAVPGQPTPPPPPGAAPATTPSAGAPKLAEGARTLTESVNYTL